MDFELSEGQRAVQEMVRDFAEREIRPAAVRYDERAEFPWDLVRKMGPLGLLGVVVPEAYGGAGMGTVSYALAIEEIARHDGALALTVASHNSLCQGHIWVAGSEAQKRKYLPPLARGEVMGAWGLTEPGSGSDAAGLRTIASLQGEHWVLNGSKSFITQGSVGQTYVVLASTDPTRGTHGISAFILERGTPG